MDTTIAVRSPLVRTAGLLCIAGGVVGAIGGVVTATIAPAVEVDRYSYPYTPTGFLVAQLVFILNHVLILAGVAGLARSGAAGTGRLGRSGLWIAAMGWVALTLCEVRAMTLANSPYPAPSTDVLDGAFGMASILIGVGLVLAGIAVVSANVFSGWYRYITLACGVAVFVMVIPGILGGFLAARIVLTVWVLMLAALGYALYAESSQPDRSPTPATA